ncbi:primosomal protein DnaI [Seinonella peptonophila]|uniref:Primosomal protein DnaI n=1 Tax=Seinonella peptonophila TaxID=112248 RepID=A0A1M4W782_9BACL|nr:primosomal protein DnaI [Seinonella peptonophila]SHE77121.1 primosomal protein DnaI [Seinonella peptonophila]
MKKIAQVVSPKWKERIDQQKIHQQIDQLENHPLIADIKRKHPSLHRKQIHASYSQLTQYIEERTNCQQCPGLEKCPNLVKGHYPQIQFYGSYFSLQMTECDYRRQEREARQRAMLIRCHQIPPDIQQATFRSIEQSQTRGQAIRAALAFCMQITNGEKPKGLYFYGSFGVGKSYIAGAIVNELAENGISSVMMHMSALSVEMKESISEQNVSSKITALSEVPVLVLDDIGSENISPWLRDDILSIIFHQRMTNQLPTIYTSNLSLDELHDYFSYTQKGGTESVKGARIMERIRPFVTPIYLKGKNRRYS